jgi:hypothetical protein
VLRTLLAYAMSLKMAQDLLAQFLAMSLYISFTSDSVLCQCASRFFVVTLGSSTVKTLITLPKLNYYWCSVVSSQLLVALPNS